MKPLNKYIQEKDKVCLVCPYLPDKIEKFIKNEFPDLDISVSSIIPDKGFGFVYKLKQKHIYFWENKIKNE